MQLHPLPHFDARPAGTTIDTFIIHSMYNPSSQDPYDPRSVIGLLDQVRVSAHYVLDRKGELWKLVEEDQRAWHAGISLIPFPDDPRDNLNHFSIGIELIAKESDGFLEVQYQALSKLIVELLQRYPLQYVLGHCHVAPDRKTDPGIYFDWEQLRRLTQARLGKDPKIRWGDQSPNHKRA